MIALHHSPPQSFPGILPKLATQNGSGVLDTANNEILCLVVRISKGREKCRKVRRFVGPRSGSRRRTRVSATAPSRTLVRAYYVHIILKMARDVCGAALRLLRIEDMHRYEALQTDDRLKCAPDNQTLVLGAAGHHQLSRSSVCRKYVNIALDMQDGTTLGRSNKACSARGKSGSHGKE